MAAALHGAVIGLLLQTAPLAVPLEKPVVYFEPITRLKEISPTPPVKESPPPPPTPAITVIGDSKPKKRTPDTRKATSESAAVAAPVAPTPTPTVPAAVLVPVPVPVAAPTPTPPPELVKPEKLPEPELAPAPLPVPVPAAQAPAPTTLAQAPAALAAAPATAAAQAATPIAHATPGGVLAPSAITQGNQRATGTAATNADANKPGNYAPMMRNVPRQRSVSDMANEQLNPNLRRDKLAEGINAAGKADCLSANKEASLLGLLTLPFDASRDKCK